MKNLIPSIIFIALLATGVSFLVLGGTEDSTGFLSVGGLVLVVAFVYLIGALWYSHFISH